MYVKTSLDVGRSKDVSQNLVFPKERLKMLPLRDSVMVVLVFLSWIYVVLLNNDEAGKPFEPDNPTSGQDIVDQSTPPVDNPIVLENINMPLLPPKDVANFDVENVLHSVNMSIDPSKMSKIPTAKGIDDIFGAKPIVSGLNQCIRYQHSNTRTNRTLAPVGLFNVDTSLITSLLEKNCNIPKLASMPKEDLHSNMDNPRASDENSNESYGKIGILDEAPWGKHNPHTYWSQYHAGPNTFKQHPEENILPIVIIRDPIMWMKSMCETKDPKQWSAHQKKTCPIFTSPTTTTLDISDEMGLPKSFLKTRKPTITRNEAQITVQYSNSSPTETYENLIDLWNKWNLSWLVDATRPRIILRYEDLLFHPKPVIQLVCNCVAGVLEDDFSNPLEQTKLPRSFLSKKKRKEMDLMSAIIESGNKIERENFLSPEELEYARKYLDETLMSLFHYSI